MSKNRLKYPTNPLIGYLNINSLRNKIIDVREVIGKLSLDYFVISETKLDESFPSAQFNISNYEIRNRRDRDKNGGGLIEFVRKGFITKRLKDYETQICETICSEFTISKRKWICFSVYRPPSYTNLIIFFEELTKSVCKALNRYDNIIVMGDFNIDINKDDAIDHDKLDVFCDTLNLTNLVKSETCYTNNHKSTIDLFLTNKPRSFQFTSATETGLSNYHRLITTFIKSYFSRLEPKIIHYRNFKRFDEQKFIADVKNADFDGVPHDLLLAKLAAYGVNESFLCYIYSYLLNRKQCVRINNINSDFLTVISGVPQGSIVGPILFNCFFNDFFYVIEIANAHNFADDNMLTAFANSIQNLIHLLESECSVAIKWFKDNKMIVNPGKFQAIILDKKKTNHTQETIKIDNKTVKVKSSVKLLGVQIDAELNFNLHNANICRSAANQLNALIRLRKFLGFEEKKVLINSYFYSNFNYCPLVWMFSHAKSLKKVEALQKRALRFLYNDYNTPLEEILKKSGKVCMEVNRLRYLCIEIYKSINNINPSFMKQIFQLRETNRTVRKQYRLNLCVPKVNQVSYGEKSLRFYGPKIWNSLPLHVKTSDNLKTFKDIIQNWNGSTCNSRVCQS